MLFYLTVTLIIYAVYRLTDFNEAVRRRVATHEKQWGPARVPGPSSLNAFQEAAEVRLRAALETAGALVAPRRAGAR